MPSCAASSRTRVHVPHSLGLRGHSARLPRLGCGCRRAAVRDVRVRDLGRPPPIAAPGARSSRSETAVLGRGRRPLPVRFGGQGNPRGPRHDAQRGPARVGALPRARFRSDAVVHLRRNPQAAGGHSLERRAGADARLSAYWSCRFRRRTRRRSRKRSIAHGAVRHRRRAAADERRPDRGAPVGRPRLDARRRGAAATRRTARDVLARLRRAGIRRIGRRAFRRRLAGDAASRGALRRAFPSHRIARSDRVAR